MASTQTISWLPVTTFRTSPCPPGKLPLPPMSSGSRTVFHSPQGTFLCLSPAPSHLSNSSNNSPGYCGSINSSGGSYCGSSEAKRRRREFPGDLSRCKRRIDFAGLLQGTAGKAASVARRNERERNRVRQVNHGFALLRDHVPQGWRNKKLSKVDTLRSAMSYIQHLKELLDENKDDSTSNTDSTTPTTPCKDESSPSPSPCTDSVGDSASPGGYSSDCGSSAGGLDIVPSPEPAVLNAEDFDLGDFASWF